MAAIQSKVDLCNMALSRMGNYGTVSNIDAPTDSKEITFSLWYDITRQNTLKLCMPNCALERRIIALVVETPAFGYRYVYEYPIDCLKVLGIGEVSEKKNDYAIENGKIYTDELYEDGLPLRFIRDLEDVTKFSPEFKDLMSWALARNTVMEITQDVNKLNLIMKNLPAELSQASGLNAQENRPIRISNSRFLQSRYYPVPMNPTKR